MCADFPLAHGALAVALLLGGLLPSPAAAATLASPPIVKSGGSLVECSIANVSGSAAAVAIRIVNNDKVIERRDPQRVPAGESIGAEAFCASECVRPRCEFTTSAAASRFRASACVARHSSTNTDKVCLPAE